MSSGHLKLNSCSAPRDLPLPQASSSVKWWFYPSSDSGQKSWSDLRLLSFFHTHVQSVNIVCRLKIHTQTNHLSPLPPLAPGQPTIAILAQMFGIVSLWFWVSWGLYSRPCLQGASELTELSSAPLIGSGFRGSCGVSQGLTTEVGGKGTPLTLVTAGK